MEIEILAIEVLSIDFVESNKRSVGYNKIFKNGCECRFKVPYSLIGSGKTDVKSKQFYAFSELGFTKLYVNNDSCITPSGEVDSIVLVSKILEQTKHTVLAYIEKFYKTRMIDFSKEVNNANLLSSNTPTKSDDIFNDIVDEFGLSYKVIIKVYFSEIVIGKETKQDTEIFTVFVPGNKKIIISNRSNGNYFNPEWLKDRAKMLVEIEKRVLKFVETFKDFKRITP